MRSDPAFVSPRDPLPARRRFVAGCGALLAGLGAPALAAARPRRAVSVLTGYPQQTTTLFAAAFEQAHPGLRLQFVWRMGHDIAAFLDTPEGRAVDVVWAAATRSFETLADAGELQRLGPPELPLDGLPARVGGSAISDAGGRYLASEMAGYGFVHSPRRLAGLGLAAPGDWPDLASPAWADRVAVPVPSRVGYAPVMVDIVLQAFGWARGWAIWSAIAGNARWVQAGSTLVTDEVASGRAAVGLTIDFFAASAIARGLPLRIAYPAHGGLNPAHIAVPRRSPHRDGALAFVRFVLSETGQALLAHPTIRKLPVRPSVYARLPGDQFDPFAAAADGALGYDNAAGRARLGLVAALFEQAFVVDHAEHAAAWRRLHAAESAGRGAAEARALLETPPLDAVAAADVGLLARFPFVAHAAPAPASAAETAWREAASRRRQQALERLA